MLRSEKSVIKLNHDFPQAGVKACFSQGEKKFSHWDSANAVKRRSQRFGKFNFETLNSCQHTVCLFLL